MVAGMDAVAGRAIGRAMRAAAMGVGPVDGESLPDAPGGYVHQ
jgi:hypothetical protein